MSPEPTQHSVAEVGFLLSGGGRMRRARIHYPMSRIDWAIAVAMAFPFALFFLLVGFVLVLG